jgi:prevent-host-death family protein
METVTIHQAKTHFSRYVERAEKGEEIIIARGPLPVARLTPLEQPKRTIVFGALEGKLRVPDDFDAPLPDDVLASFEGV